jgi:pseudouridylate synthase
MVQKELFSLSREVESALNDGLPVVALESTVIAHGLPRPLNREVANQLQKIVSKTGATPAMTAVLNGRLKAGLTDDEIRVLAESQNIRKLSIRDLPIAVAEQWNGATTVATTLWIAHRAGIKVFATGGIGGVHRGELPDISADLPELARTPMIVVCSGAKIVLDLPATREWLETHGVTLLGYECDELPAFYSRQSGLAVDARVNSGRDVVAIAKANWALQKPSAILVAVPVPEHAEVNEQLLRDVLNDALLESERLKISGRELTPFLLSRMVEKSEGATLRANVALLENNARIAAEIAHSLAH